MKKLKVISYQLKVTYVLAISATIAGPVFSQNNSATSFSFSLQQAIDYAMQNQTKVQNAMYDEQIAQNKVKEIRGIGLPQINGSFDVKDFLDIPTTIIPANAFNPLAPKDLLIPVNFGLPYSSSAGIDASQLVFEGSYIVGLQATKVYLDLSRKATQRTKIETVVGVTKAYYSVLLNDERMKLMEANVTRLKKLMDDTKALNDNGFVEKLDLDRITVTYNNLVVEKEKIQRFLDLSTALLKYQMSMDQNASLILTDKIADVKFDSGNVSAEKFDYSKRVEYSLMQTQNAGAKLQLKKDRFGYLPNMVLYGSASLNAMRLKFDIFDFSQKWYPTTVIGAKIGIPIFDGLQKNYRIQQSKLGILKSENDLKFIQQSIDLELASTKATLLNSSSSLETQKKNIELAEDVYRVAKLKYDQGVGSNLEVLNSETALKEAQTNYYNALYDALIAKVEYEKASGAITK
jgi:outer membrane protein